MNQKDEINIIIRFINYYKEFGYKKMVYDNPNDENLIIDIENDIIKLVEFENKFLNSQNNYKEIKKEFMKQFKPLYKIFKRHGKKIK